MLQVSQQTSISELNIGSKYQNECVLKKQFSMTEVPKTFLSFWSNFQICQIFVGQMDIVNTQHSDDIENKLKGIVQRKLRWFANYINH